MASALSSKSMELEGNLRTFQLPDILRFLAMGRMTGALLLNGQKQEIELYIKEGRLAGTQTEYRLLRLGELLIYSGHLTQRDLADALDTQRETDNGRMLGEMLIEKQLVTSQQLEDALRLQIKEELWELFSWTDGIFKFEHGEMPAMRQALLELEIEPLIEEGMQRMEQWRQITANLGNEHEIYKVRSDIASIPEARLNPNTWRVLALINGRTSIRHLIFQSGLGKFETLCALDRLLSQQLIEPVDMRVLQRVRCKSPASANIQLVRADQTKASNGRQGDTAAARLVKLSDRENGETATGLLGMFGRKRKPAAGEPAMVETAPAPVGQFLTSVGLACVLFNRLMDRLADEHEAGELAEQLWNEETLRYSRADLIVLHGGRLDAALWEGFVQAAGGITPQLASCHEDAMGAATGALRGLVSWALETQGEKVTALVDEIARPYIAHAEVTWPGDFDAAAWAREWKSGGKG